MGDDKTDPRFALLLEAIREVKSDVRDARIDIRTLGENLDTHNARTAVMASRIERMDRDIVSLTSRVERQSHVATDVKVLTAKVTAIASIVSAGIVYAVKSVFGGHH